MQERDYIVTVEDDDGPLVFVAYLSFAADGSRRFVTHDVYQADPGDVIAWRPMPEPYRPGTESGEGGGNL